jgi:hypothetical protein
VTETDLIRFVDAKAQIHTHCEILKDNTQAISKASGRIPYATEQGIISAE